MPARKRPIAVTALSAIVAACLLVPAEADARSAPTTTGPSATFTFPATGSTSYGTIDGWSVSWDVTGNFATQRVTEATAPADADGGCRSVSYVDGAVHDGAISPLNVGGDPGSCHRYRVGLLDHSGHVLATAISGNLRSLTSWTGYEELFRHGEFSTQLTWTWCVGASVQIMLNEIKGRHDHSRHSQWTYMRYARQHDRHYRRPIRGSDPQGWAAALNRFNGGSGYRVHADGNFQRAVHDAARRIRLTGHPVGLLVKTGVHAWVMSGFKATADPALTNNFIVTAVYVEGPLFPMQQAYGYDMAPDTRLSLARFRLFFRRYDDRRAGTAWDNRFVTIQP
jgi:hypothetical protein